MRDKSGSGFSGKFSLYVIISLLVLVAVLGGGGYAWISHSTQKESAAPLEQVRIANFFYTGSCSAIAAQAKGYFTSEGIQTSFQAFGSGPGTLDAMFSGKADLAISGEIPVMFSVMNGQPLSVIATIVKAENVVGIVGRKDRGITTPTSLKGKRIGVTIRTAGHFLLSAFLTQQKLSASDVILKDYDTEALPGALARGEIDAASTWEPMLGELETQLGANGVTFIAGGLYSPTLHLVGTQAYVASHEKTLQKVLLALIRGADFCSDNPDEARELVAASLRINPEDLAGSWPDYRFRVTLDQSLVLQLEDESRWAMKNKLSNRSEMPNYLGHIDIDPLQAVAPAAITVIH